MSERQKKIEELILCDFLTTCNSYGEPTEIKLDSANFKVLMDKLNEVIREINKINDQKTKEN